MDWKASAIWSRAVFGNHPAAIAALVESDVRRDKLVQTPFVLQRGLVVRRFGIDRRGAVLGTAMGKRLRGALFRGHGMDQTG